MDALLAYDVLMYINLYYFPMWSTCTTIMTTAKYKSIIDTPLIERDASVQAAILSSELLKLATFRKLRDKRTGWSVSVSMFFSSISMLGLLYVFFIQHPVLQLEQILDVMMFVMLTGEVGYGMLALLSCCKENEFA